MSGRRSRRVSLIGLVEILLGALCLASVPCFGFAGILSVVVRGVLGYRGIGPYPPPSGRERLEALVIGLAALLAGLAVLVVGVLYVRAGRGVLARRRSGRTWTLRLAVVNGAVVLVGFAAAVSLADSASTPWHVLPRDQSDREVALMFGLPVVLLCCGLQAWVWSVFHDERFVAEFDSGIPGNGNAGEESGP
jgi:hypothetical protein